MEIDDEAPLSDSVTIAISLSPSSSSSSSASSSCSASVFPLPFSPLQQTAGSPPYRPLRTSESGEMLSLAGWSHDGERLRFVDAEGNEWGNVVNRFNQMAAVKGCRNGHQEVVKWSDFGSCIGEGKKI